MTRDSSSNWTKQIAFIPPVDKVVQHGRQIESLWKHNYECQGLELIAESSVGWLMLLQKHTSKSSIKSGMLHATDSLHR